MFIIVIDIILPDLSCLKSLSCVSAISMCEWCQKNPEAVCCVKAILTDDT